MLGANILIADDDEVSARFLTRLLTKERCRVRVVHTRDAALAACAAKPPDLVLLDLLALRGHGFDVCRALKSRADTRLIPVVIVTARSDARDRLTSIEAGCDDFITKPYDEAELRALASAHSSGSMALAIPIDWVARRFRLARGSWPSWMCTTR